MSRSCPQGDVFKRGEHIRTHEAREPANLFAGDGIAFVGHGGTAARCSPLNGLFGFADFGALQMANLSAIFSKRGRR